MKLVSARVQNFRSINDSGEFSINNTTCLVGKNEAGKTAILQALEGIKPLNTNHGGYDKTRDYPRPHLNSYKERHPNSEAIVTTTKWFLDDTDTNELKKEFGADFLTNREIVVTKHYSNSLTFSIAFNESEALSGLVSNFNLNATEKSGFGKFKNSKDLYNHLQTQDNLSEKQTGLLNKLKGYRDQDIMLKVIDILSPRIPKFMYFSHWDRMSGIASIAQLEHNKSNMTLTEGDKVFLDFLEFAGTGIEELKSAKHYEDLRAKVEAASNKITDRIFEYWSQNRSLSIEFDIHEGKPADPPPFNSGTVMAARVKNALHRMSLPFSERSAGFIWFFSFLVRFSQVKKVHGSVIILLDEPGLTLHAKAQGDLLRYIKEKLEPNHQVIYTTHSPFMVPPDNLMSARTVEDVVAQPSPGNFVSNGTKVGDKVLSSDRDTLFPLQGALGFEITQSLFIGEHTLLVEGPSDILYLQAASIALKARNRTELNPKWTICPSGGIDKVSPFVSLFAGNLLHIAVLTDIAKGQKKKVEYLRKLQLLKENHVYTYADFCEKEEADVEDILSPKLFVSIINQAYMLTEAHELTEETLNNADTSTERQVIKAEAYFRLLPETVSTFNHFTPANWLIQNPKALAGKGKDIENTLNKFEQIFETLNGLLD